MAVRGDVFAREGEYWTVIFDGTVSRLRDSKGMRYLAQLLTHPGEEFAPLDLAGGQAVPGDAGEVLDQQAVRAYRERSLDLRSELDEAESFGDIERAARVRVELDALTEQLSAAVGLHGRRRSSGAASERARVAVTKAIRTAVARIHEADPQLGRHLDSAVRTGTRCSYRPDTRLEPQWTDSVEQPPVRRTSPVLARSLAPFVGRNRELATLRAAAEAAAGGAGALALVAGDPGVGKSRLLDELATAVEPSGMQVLAGRCAEEEQALAYLPFIEIFEQLVRDEGDDELDRLLGDEAGEISRLVPKLRLRTPASRPSADPGGAEARRLLSNAVADVLGRLAAESPRLLVVEDIHWADGPSLLLLEHLAARLSSMPILLVCSYRGVDAGAGTALARTLEQLIARHDSVRVNLPPLEPDEITDLVTGLHGSAPPGGLLQRLTEESGGNPFFVEELYQHVVERGELPDGQGSDRLPESIRLVLGRRLERLSATCREALAIAAIAGHDFDETLLTAAGAAPGEVEGALDEALAAGLLSVVETGEAGADRYRFAHALVRRAIIAGLSPARRRRLHLALADAIERLHDGDAAHVAKLADQLEQAGSEAQPLRVALAQQAAARRMFEVAAFEDALDRLERALARCPRGEPVHVAELLADRGNVHRALGRMTEAFADWYAALDRGGEGWRRAPRICRDLARTLDITGRLDEAGVAARRGLRLAGEEPTPERSRLLASLAYTLDLGGAVAEAERALEEALAIADRLGDARVRGDVQAAAVSHWFISADHVAEARAAKEAADLLVASGELWDAAQAGMMRMLNALRRGSLDETQALDEEVARLCRRSGHRIAELWRRRCVEAVRLARTADLDPYAQFTEEDLEFCRAGGVRWLADALLHAGMCAFWKGDVQRARTYLDEAAGVPTPPAYIGRYSSARFLIEAWAGDEVAFERHRSTVERALVDAGLEDARTLGGVIYVLSSLEGHALLDHREQASALRAHADEAAGRGMVLRLGDLRLVPVLRAVAAACAGDWAEAGEAADEARRLIDGVPYRREEPDMDLFRGLILRMRARPGDDRRSREAYSRAAQRYRQLRMPWHARLAASRA